MPKAELTYRIDNTVTVDYGADENVEQMTDAEMEERFCEDIYGSRTAEAEVTDFFPLEEKTDV